MPSLDQWEKRLQPAFKHQIKMIGEIGLSRLEMEDIANSVRFSIKQSGFGRTTQLLFNQYPFTFLSLLTFFSTYNTAYDYWGALAEEIGTERSYLFNRDWHKTFVNKIKALRLRAFDIEDVSRPYVTTIRFHGGIPVYSLPDYFRTIVLPSVDRPGLNEVQSDQVLRTLLDTAFHVHAPVRNFLENSGESGLEFFEASQQLARHYRQYGTILSSDEIDLPEHIIEAFESFVQDVLKPSERGLQTRFRKPVLLFTPYYDQGHLFVRLPEQDIPLRYAEGQLGWHVSWSDSPTLLQHPCKVKMQRQNMVIEELYLPIDAAPKAISISLIYQRPDQSLETLREWSIRLKPSDEAVQLITFRWDGVLLHPGNPLPAEELILVYPQEMTLHLEASSQPSRVYGQLFGAWSSWQAHGWDLSHSSSLQLMKNDVPVGSPIPIAGKLPLPELLGEPEKHDLDPSGTHLYIGEVPKLRIPVRPDMPLHRELDRWRIKIFSIGQSSPDCDLSDQIGKFQSSIDVRDDWATLPLTTLLGSSPVGTFTVCLSGPIDDDMEFRFRLWPKAEIYGLKPALFPGPTGPETQTLTLRMPDNAQCEVQAGAEGVEVNGKLFGWQIVVTPETTRADLNLIWKQPDHADVWVPFYLSIPRLRWFLALDQDQGEFNWSFQVIQRSIDQILQSEAGAIHVNMPGIDTAYQLSLDLIEADDTERLRQSETFQHTPFSPDWKRIGLERFVDTLHHNSGLLHFDLSYQATWSDKVIHVQLVLVTRSLDLTNVNLIPLEELSWRIIWNVGYHVKNCWVMLQPAWQPWISPLQFRIPDISTGSFDILKIGLPSSRYHLHFYISAFEKPLPNRIPRSAQVFHVDLCNPDDRLAELDIQLQDAVKRNANEAIFKTIFEMVCIYDDIGDATMRDRELSKLATTFVHTTNLQLLLSFFQWLDDRSLQGPYASFFFNFMFKPELVKQILPHYQKNAPELKAYLTYVPRVKNIYGQSALLIAQSTDDPAVLTTCFHRLLQQEDSNLIPLLLEMIERARITNQDVVDLLALKPAWSFNSLLEYQPSHLIDALLGSLVEKHCALLDNLSPQTRHSLILRILSYIVDQNLWITLVRDLVIDGDIEGYRVIMDAQRTNKLDHNSIAELLSLAPKKSIQILRDTPAETAHKAWLDWLYDHFPTQAGFIKAGCKVTTPFGSAIIENIETDSGESVHLADPHRSDLRILVSIGEGRYKEVAVIDNSNCTLYFPNATSAWQCGNCNYTSPSQRAIQQHHNDVHRYMSLSFRKVSPQIDITPGDIQIIEEG